MSSNSETSSTPRCSICLDSIISGNGRSTATLSCSHLFHLDCIGSEFNCKGIMQCPNCRFVEQGDWQFAAGNFLQDITNDDQEDQENNPQYIDMDHVHAPLLNAIRNQFPNPSPQTIRNYTQLPTPTALSFTGISQPPQNRLAQQTHHHPFSISIAMGHDVGITIESHANFASPRQAHEQANLQSNGFSLVQNIRVVPQQQSSIPTAAAVQVRQGPMSQNVHGLHASVPQQAFVNHVAGATQPPRQTTEIFPNTQPSQTDEEDENSVPMFRFL